MSEASSSAVGLPIAASPNAVGCVPLKFDGLNAVKSEAARFLARFPAVFARLRTTSAGEKRVIPGC